MRTLFSKLTEQVTVLTPNRRLSTQLKKTFTQEQSTNSWQIPDILPWEAWLQRCYETLLVKGITTKQCLTSEQTQILWQSLIEEYPPANGLLNVNACVMQAQQAWSAIHGWQLDWRQWLGDSTQEIEQFCQWAKLFEERCQAEGWLTQPELASLVRQHLSHLQLPTQFIWYGFLELTPALEAMQQTLRAQQIAQESMQVPHLTPNVSVKTFATHQEELQAMAQWAKSCYDKDPNSRIACVIPNLTQQRVQLERIFRKTFYPKKLFSKATERDGYNISGGESLAQVAVIKTALSLWQLAHWRIPLSVISNLLRSPYLAAATEEGAARAQLEFQLYEHGEALLTHPQLLSFTANAAPHWFAALSKAFSIETKGKRFPSEWPVTLLAWLQAFGWPGERVLDSDEYQQMMRLQPLLDQCSTFDDILGPISWQRMVSLLQQIATQTVFQVETENRGMQVLGMLEAAGQHYDALWIANLQDDVFPTQAKPNPFIPLAVQKEQGLPHCDPQRELTYCDQLLQALIHSAAETHLSYPLIEGERSLSPSSLLQEWGVATCPIPLNTSWLPQQPLQVLLDEQGPAVKNPQTMRGGTGVIKSQALCGFQAFARYRLHAQSLDDLKVGLDFLDRGILLHDVLQHFWVLVKDQQTLLSQKDWSDCLESVTQQVLTRYQRKYPSIVTKTFARLEQQRLVKLLKKWLVLEAEREPFAIYALEQPIALKVGELELRGKIDRIDQLPNGEWLLIDYKTGSTSPASWFGDRPSEPQLPLYALAQSNPLAGIVFAEVALNQMRFNGITRDENVLPKVKALAKTSKADAPESWTAQLSHWQQVLQQLAQQFCEGHAAVDPKDSATCQYCDLTSLCRYFLPQEVV
jgi:probable DNA repair protein